MIDPTAIHRQAERLYGEYLAAWLAGNECFFPCTLRGRKQPESGDLARAADGVRRLRQASKEVRGFGYSVVWRQINSRTFGCNLFPETISFDTPADLLKFLGKEREFARLVETVTRVRCEFPMLDGWIRNNLNVMLEVADELEGLLKVVAHLRDHPRPMRFARELPLPVDTKFIERHRAVLRQWQDRSAAVAGYRVAGPRDSLRRGPFRAPLWLALSRDSCADSLPGRAPAARG